jgi:hypothetical protein
VRDDIPVDLVPVFFLLLAVALVTAVIFAFSHDGSAKPAQPDGPCITEQSPGRGGSNLFPPRVTA